MATFDDFDGVRFTIQAIRMYQREVLANLSFVAIDDHPEGAAALKALRIGLPLSLRPDSARRATRRRPVAAGEG